MKDLQKHRSPPLQQHDDNDDVFTLNLLIYFTWELEHFSQMSQRQKQSEPKESD